MPGAVPKVHKTQMQGKPQELKAHSFAIPTAPASSSLNGHQLASIPAYSPADADEEMNEPVPHNLMDMDDEEDSELSGIEDSASPMDMGERVEAGVAEPAGHGRHPRQAHFSDAYTPMLQSDKWKPVQRSDTSYPPYGKKMVADYMADQVPDQADYANKLSTQLFRPNFPAETTAAMKSHNAGKKRKINLTAQDVEMANKSDERTGPAISRNHKVADSSIRGLMIEQAALQRNGPLPDGHQELMTGFFHSVVGDQQEAEDMYDNFASMHGKRALAHNRPILGALIGKLSNHPRNLRFGDAETNQRILHGFDGNMRDGRMTPISQGIQDSLHALTAVSPSGAALAAATPSKDKDSGEALSSSHSVEPSPKKARPGDARAAAAPLFRSKVGKKQRKTA